MQLLGIWYSVSLEYKSTSFCSMHVCGMLNLHHLDSYLIVGVYSTFNEGVSNHHFDIHVHVHV
jgi:hypothetical protein